MDQKIKQNILIVFSIFCFYVFIFSLQTATSSDSAKLLPNPFKFHKNKQVWAIYIGNYGNPEFDGRWVYWNAKDNYFINETFIPYIKNPTNEMPEYGFYSSNDETILKNHMNMLKNIGIDAIIINWTNNKSDESENERYTKYTSTYISHLPGIEFNYTGTIINMNTFPYNDALAKIFNACKEFNINVGLLIPETENRTLETIENDIDSFYYLAKENNIDLRYYGKNVVFIEGFVNTSFNEEPQNSNDYFYISLVNNQKEAIYAFDSFYDCLSFDINNDQIITTIFENRNISLIPTASPLSSIGVGSIPSYMRTRNIDFYQQQMYDAIHFDSNVILIDSFNNWIKGTQIESSYASSNKLKEGDFIALTKQIIHDL